MALTSGLNHLGLAVADLEQTHRFFTEVLGFYEVLRDASYPRTAVTDGVVRISLWQVDRTRDVQPFDRRRNIGLHHLALAVESEAQLNAMHTLLQGVPGVQIEFAPELLAGGPRKHMMCREPGGIRIEFIWPAT